MTKLLLTFREPDRSDSGPGRALARSRIFLFSKRGKGEANSCCDYHHNRKVMVKRLNIRGLAGGVRSLLLGQHGFQDLPRERDIALLFESTSNLDAERDVH